MDDIIRIVLNYLRTEYGSTNASLYFGYKVKIEPQIRFTLPNYKYILAEIPAKNLIVAQKKVGTEQTLRILDKQIEEMLLEYRKRFG